MELQDALAEDILAVIPPSGVFKPAYRIVNEVSPLRDRDVRAAIKLLVQRGWLDVNRGGGGWPAYYRRRPLRRI